MCLLAVVAIVLGGCQGDRARPATAIGILFSPNGEPLSGGPLGHPKCEEALSGWFGRLAGSQGGTIDRATFMGDAKVQFNRMDLHHNGYVTAVDLSEFRAPYEPQYSLGERPGDRVTLPETRDDRRQRHADEAGRFGATRSPTVDTRADPVMSADKSLSFKVTLDDFLDHANGVFTSLDADRDGRLSLAESLALCKPPAAGK